MDHGDRDLSTQFGNFGFVPQRREMQNGDDDRAHDQAPDHSDYRPEGPEGMGAVSDDRSLGSPAVDEPVVCLRCGELGHVTKRCPLRSSGGAGAPSQVSQVGGGGGDAPVGTVNGSHVEGGGRDRPYGAANADGPHGTSGGSRYSDDDDDNAGGSSRPADRSERGGGGADGETGGFGGNSMLTPRNNDRYQRGSGGGRDYGGGSGGGRDYGSNSRACHNCKKEGHISRDCPERPQRSGDNECRYCHKEGHFARDCPEKSGGGSRECHYCHKEGHIARDCPEKSGGGGDECRYCHKEGHVLRDCPERPGGGGDNECRYCHKEGHVISDCPEKPVLKCFNCNEIGHMSKNCPKKDEGDGDRDGERGPGDRNDRGCFNCGQPGHRKSDCPEEPRDRTRDTKAAATYMPEEVEADDRIFDDYIPEGANVSRHIDSPVQVKEGTNVPPPIASFEDFPFSPKIMSNIRKMYTVPLAVQKHAIPIIAAGRDLIACAQTGSGKSAAFLLPIVDSILKNPNLDLEGTSVRTDASVRPVALILAPTRELVLQLHKEFLKFCLGTVLQDRVYFTMGGVVVRGASETLRRRNPVALVSTIGRLKMFVEQRVVDLREVKTLVLDEADRMLSKEMCEETRDLLRNFHMNAARQTVMFSATFPEAVQHVAGSLMKPDRIFISVGAADSDAGGAGAVGAANQDVRQIVLSVPRFDKRAKLDEVIDPSQMTIIFVGTRQNCDFLSAYLAGESTRDKPIKSTTIHGGMRQEQRAEAMHMFKTGKVACLVSTSLSAYGLDIKGVGHVINYDLPEEIEEFIHRIGRTGRVGNPGLATSFFDPEDNKNLALAPDLIDVLAKAQQEVPEFLKEAARKGENFRFARAANGGSMPRRPGGGGRGGRFGGDRNGGGGGGGGGGYDDDSSSDEEGGGGANVGSGGREDLRYE